MADLPIDHQHSFGLVEQFRKADEECANAEEYFLGMLFNHRSKATKTVHALLDDNTKVTLINEQLRKDKRDAAASNIELTQSRDALYNDLDVAKRQMEEASEKLEKQQQLTTAAREECCSLRNQLEEANRKAADHMTTIDNLQMDMKRLEQSLDETRKQKASAIERRKEAIEHIAELKSDLEETQGRKEVLKSMNGQLDAQRKEREIYQ